jgi:hypothetical protein
VTRKRAAAVLLVAALLLSPRAARADDYGGSRDEWMALFYMLAAAGVLALADTGLATADAVMAANHDVPGGGYNIFEGVFGGAQAALGAAVVPAFGKDDGDGAFATLAVTSLPFAVSMHGLWAGTSGYDGFPYQATPVAALDASILAWDVVQIARGKRQDTFYGLMEILGGLPQAVFGATVAAAGRKQDLAPALGFAALPSLMLVHGLYVCLRPDPKPTDAGLRRRGPRVAHGAFTVAPAMVAPGAGGLTVLGAF